jgi:hypothetical protein
MNETVENPFAVATRGAAPESAGGRALQARENTEVMALAMMAKRFPRDVIVVCDRIKNAFTRVTVAAATSLVRASARPRRWRSSGAT